MRIDGAPNTLALADHADHIHVGWRPGAVSGLVPEPADWARLSDRLSEIENPRPAQRRPARRPG